MHGFITVSSSRRRGFTIIELMIVIAIIAILGSILLSSVMVVKKRANISKTRMLLQNLVNAIETMKTDYGYTRAIGVDEDGNLLALIDLDDIDLGKELNPKSPFWNPVPDIALGDIRLNKRLKTYYEVHSGQVIGNQFVDPFGYPVRYRVDMIDIDVDIDGFDEHYADEYLVAFGPDGMEGTDDDITWHFPRRAFLGSDKPPP